ncbi:putative membrane protein [Leptospira inadai serovar Lyme str. 10]|uniref:Formate hydrogenase n=2 Tax=Leptospira inadai serovar Lyme TaxID=293084 RepID=A0ABX4YMA1_9LEPT|nr:NADH-quinone oxidoreductase subunit H [Leptospira inadai]EQA37257.1 putative membrane protein [Leptospira inadai serovar Lyme str. 10]PNV76351.1 formate hydrogenase [Leptospira inadai serovar Lyme]
METNYFSVDTLIRIISFLLLPFLCGGIIQKIRAYGQGRRGAPVLQILYDTVRMIRKYPIDGPFSGFFTESAAIFAFTFGVALWSLITFEWASLLLVPFLIGMIRFATVSYAVENGTSFGGMGAARETLLYVLAEPILILVLVVFESNLVFQANFANLSFGILFFFGALLIVLSDLAKPPFDDPRTHLELTMVHEAMLLEASGRTRALFELAHQLKTASLLLLLTKLGLEHIEIFLNLISSPLIRELTATGGALFLSALIGYWESNSTRRKWVWIPELLGLNFIFMLILGILLKLG